MTDSIHRWWRWILTLLVVALVACSSPPILLGENNPRVDLSGNWELDYALSDNLRENIERLRRMSRQPRDNRAKGPLTGPQGFPGPAMRGGTSPVTTAAAIVGLGQLADMISRTVVLEIEHTPANVVIRRSNDFSLICSFHGGQAQPAEDVLGTEVCGWDARQLVFMVALPEGLNIDYRITLSARGERLNIATTVRSSEIPEPFTLNRVYQRYQPLPDDDERDPGSG